MARIGALMVVSLGLGRGGWAAEALESKPRLVILTDIGGDPDDQQSLIRLMTYANQFEIEALIASAAGTPGELKDKVTRPDLIRQIVTAYGRVRDNLAQHAEGYPTAEYLLARIQAGNPRRGPAAIGQGNDTPASAWIISVVDRPDPRPIHFAIWGGQTDLAQALWRVREDRGADRFREFLGRIRVYDIGDQDRIVAWIWSEFPGIFYILGQAAADRDMREAVYRGMYLGGDESLTSRQWIEKNIRQDHGPLGELYPDHTWTAPNPHSALKEGDTPSWFYFLPNGLGDPEHPEWGGWGGRFIGTGDRLYRDAADTIGGVTDARSTVWRWRDAFQRDFQARLDWCVKPPSAANHPPMAVCNADATRSCLHVQARPGDEVLLTSAGSRDPDGHRLACRWWCYGEAGTCREPVAVSPPAGSQTRVSIPSTAIRCEIHIIMELTDDGSPPLTSYRRVVIHTD